MSTLYEKYTGSTNDFIRIRDSSSVRAGVTFTATSDHTISSVIVKVYRIGTPGTVTCSIYATSAGLPTGSPLVSQTYDGDALTTSSSGEDKEITFGTPLNLSSGVVYAIVQHCPNDQLDWISNSTGGATNDGMVASNNTGASWMDFQPNIFWFEVYGDPISTANSNFLQFF